MIVPQSQLIRYDSAVGSSRETSAAPAILPSIQNGIPMLLILQSAGGSSQDTSAAPASLPSAQNGMPMLLILPAVGSSHQTSAVPASLPSAHNGSWQLQIYGNETKIMLPNQTKVIKAFRCEVCEIEVNSQVSLENHIAGKKHKKNLQRQTNPTVASHANVQTDTSSIQGQALIGPVPEQSEPKKQVDSIQGQALIGPVAEQSEPKKQVDSVKNVQTDTSSIHGQALIGPVAEQSEPKKQVDSVNNVQTDTSGIQGQELIGPVAEHSEPKKQVDSFKNVQTDTSSIQGQALIGPVAEQSEPKKQVDSVKNVQTDTSGIQGQALIGPVAEHSEPKKQVDSVKVCSTCNVVCVGQDTYNKHVAGRKHAAKVALKSNDGIGPSIAELKRKGDAPIEKAAKKIKVAESVWCEFCKINCNSRDSYTAHISGKKHLRNLEKLSNPKVGVGSGATPTTTAAITIIETQEKPDSDNLKAKQVPELDIEAEKRKAVERGAAVNDIKMCTLCNVVCNSQANLNTHLSDHNHAAMVKKAGLITG
uniref:C2H2-type domain-containing protein n=1 Tax=Medicago truncatula TaxID=3880 RepID=I3T7T5_MEDTR|nr:unknown [Medicago truncatula]